MNLALDYSELLGPESLRLDAVFASKIDGEGRANIWHSADRLLVRGENESRGGLAGRTALALGYVQSGKTTSITAVTALAADRGYRVVVALLGSTNLLLDQNRRRVEEAIGIDNNTRNDYVWVTEPNLRGAAGARAVAQHLERGRTLFVPLLKHARRIADAASVLAETVAAGVPTLIIDDEADQASLNTAGSLGESSTYRAISGLRAAVPSHLYVQYTATPYAPLLLEADDQLKPDYVEFLEPGRGYIGGREFFVDHAAEVVRDIPMLDEQASKTAPLDLPGSLTSALAAFVVGAAVLLDTTPSAAPVSMLVHSTARNDVQTRYEYLLRRRLTSWREQVGSAAATGSIPKVFLDEYERLQARDGVDMTGRLAAAIRSVLVETTVWLVNSTSARDKVNWGVSRCHVLVGGNKLDRGFTVEGLTVTYMNRPTSPQVDTLEQRARAFGYRADQLPYCQFYASKRTIRSLRDIVYTEYDLRAGLIDTIAEGGTVHEWATSVGLLLPEGMRPTRDAVVTALSTGVQGWQSLRRPSLAPDDIRTNAELVRESGLLDAPLVDYGRISHRTLTLPTQRVVDELLAPWAHSSYSPSWRNAEILERLVREAGTSPLMPVLLMTDAGVRRTRRWDESVGFVNLFQGRDGDYPTNLSAYPGDRAVPVDEEGDTAIALQVHYVSRRGHDDRDLYTLAVNVGRRQILRRSS